MDRYSLTHLSDAAVVRNLAVLVARDRATTANLLAHLAEVDRRRLYVPAGYASMFTYCVEKFRFSEDAAYKRIQAARAARQFPALYTAIADGRLHLTAVCLIAPHLTSENVDALTEMATYRKKVEIEALLAQRDLGPVVEVREVAVIRAVPGVDARARAEAQARECENQLALEPVGSVLARVGLGVDLPAITRVEVGEGASSSSGEDNETERVELALAQVESTASPQVGRAHGSVRTPAPTPERYVIQLTISKETHDKLRRAQALLSHVVSSKDVAQVFDRALDALLAQLEKRKLGAGKRRTSRSEAPAANGAPQQNPSSSTVHEGRPKRYISTSIRRAVWERDQGQCTFVGGSGDRCTERRFLEFDHVQPVARGGKPSVDGIRLRCRTHNQYAAERVFGARFMKRKRLESQSRGVSESRDARELSRTGESGGASELSKTSDSRGVSDSSESRQDEEVRQPTT